MMKTVIGRRLLSFRQILARSLRPPGVASVGECDGSTTLRSFAEAAQSYEVCALPNAKMR
jgi:hypothetical protein